MSVNRWNDEDDREIELKGDEPRSDAGGTGELFIFAGLAVVYTLLVIFLLDTLQI